MRTDTKLSNASKSKDDQQAIAVLSTSVKETRRVAEANQLRLQQLELAIANLTTICCASRHEMYSLGSSPTKQGSLRMAQAEVIEMKGPSSTRSSSPSFLDLNDDVLRVQMHQLVKEAAALGIVKESKTNSLKPLGKTKEDLKPPTRPIRKSVHESSNQKSFKKPMIRSVGSTTEKKVSVKPETVKKYMGTTQPKAKCSPENGTGHNIKAAATAKVSLKSTVKSTKVAVSNVNDNKTAANKSKESTIKNVETTQDKGCLRRSITDHQGLKVATKCHAPTKTNPTSCAADAELKQPRKKWSTARDISFMK